MVSQLSDYDFDLPEHLIAQTPSPERSDSRMLVVHPNAHHGDVHLEDAHFKDLLHMMKPGDLLVLNDTAVLKARLFGQKITGAQVECLLERFLEPKRILAHLKTNHGITVPSELLFHGCHARVLERNGALFTIAFEDDAETLFEKHAQVPLPPYIKREPTDADRERYQTVYANLPGSVAAPTAGLHLTEHMLQTLADQGVMIEKLTLHVGSGTFKPVQVDDIHEHRMHSERFVISEQLAERWHQTRDHGGRVFAVGTTSARALESAFDPEQQTFRQGWQETDIFITPGYRFQTLDALITNFHLPKSTLLMMIAAWGGYERMKAAYEHAVHAGYRFYSYGDAMLIFPDEDKGESH